MKVTLKEIAKLAGVSEATASLAINNRPGVSFATKRKVLSIVEESGYMASQSARLLSKKQSGIIGLLIPNLNNLFYSQIVQEIETRLLQLGLHLISATTDNEPAREREMIRSFVSFGVEGVILYPLIRDHHNPDYLDILEKNKIPFVFLGGFYTHYDAPHCMSDLYNGMAELIELMYNGGCRNIVYFGSCRYIVSNQIKIKALEDKLAEKRILFHPDNDYIYLKKTNFDYAYLEARRMLQNGRSFDGAIAGDAYSGFGIYQALVECGKSVPRDAAIAHMDNMLNPSICICRMTCIEQNISELVDGTVDLLTNMMNGKRKSSLLIKTNLIIRDSTPPIG